MVETILAIKLAVMIIAGILYLRMLLKAYDYLIYQFRVIVIMLIAISIFDSFVEAFMIKAPLPFAVAILLSLFLFVFIIVSTRQFNIFTGVVEIFKKNHVQVLKYKSILEEKYADGKNKHMQGKISYYAERYLSNPVVTLVVFGYCYASIFVVKTSYEVVYYISIIFLGDYFGERF